MSLARPTVASTSRITRTLTRGYASPGYNPHTAVPTDSRTDVIRQALYPSNAASPTSSSPSGAYHPQHLERLATVIGDTEAHETIERAFQLHLRQKRERAFFEQKTRYETMVQACEALDAVTSLEGGTVPRTVYDRAMARQTMFAPEEAKGKKGPEGRWLEARIDGLVPREAWVPTETRGKGWNYEWKRPLPK